MAEINTTAAIIRGVAAYFGKNVLTEVPKGNFYTALGVLRAASGDRAVLRAIHFYEENQRVQLG